MHRGSTTFETCDMDIPSFFSFLFFTNGQQSDGKVIIQATLLYRGGVEYVN